MIAFVLFLTLGHVYFDGKIVNPYADDDDSSDPLDNALEPHYGISQYQSAYTSSGLLDMFRNET